MADCNNINKESLSTVSAPSIEGAAELLGVWVSTIRNWIRVGLIDLVGHNIVDPKSLEEFESKVVGVKRLNSRANKQHKSEPQQTPSGFKEPALYVSEDMSLYQQVAPLEMYDAPCKLVYKFISDKLCFVCDVEQRLILNSANFLILDNEFPIAAQELVKFLNCDFTNWLFQRVFSTRKVLRGDLEELPIFLECFVEGQFDEDRYLEHLGVRRVAEGEYR